MLVDEWLLFDDGTGAQGPDYGLRLDHITNPTPPPPGKIFSADEGGANVLLKRFDDNTATIEGWMRDNADNELWYVFYEMTGVADGGATSGTPIWHATGGTGTITRAGDPDSPIDLDAELNGDNEAFFLRLKDGDLEARGWLLPGGTTDDWRMKAQLIPEPGTALLVGLGLTAMGMRRRRC